MLNIKEISAALVVPARHPKAIGPKGAGTRIEEPRRSSTTFPKFGDSTKGASLRNTNWRCGTSRYLEIL